MAAAIDRALAAVGSVGAAQQAYVAPGQPDWPWMEQVSTGLQSLADATASLRARARSREAAGILQRVGDRVASLVDVDALAREHIAGGQDLLAADMIYADGRELLGAIAIDLRRLLGAERAAAAAERSAAEQRALLATGGAVVLWLAGLLFLVRVPARPVTVAAATSTPIDTPATEPARSEQPEALVPPEPVAASAPIVDLDAAADLCTAISRVTSTVQLPDLLARAAAVLDAPGLIVWLSAGDELFAVTAHGYDPRVISRLGPIRRDADNATARCWRTGEIGSVAGDMVSHGAIVAPMFGPDSCLGVLAVETRHEREADVATRAVTAMIAAQLATAVAGWPAASSVPSAAATTS